MSLNSRRERSRHRRGQPLRLDRQAPLDEQIAILEAIGRQRTAEARGAPLEYICMCPEPDENTDPSFREGYDYYRTERAFHPRADNLFLRRSQATKMAFSAIENMQLVTQPLLLIAGERADSLWQTERFKANFNNDEQSVYVIEGASHIALYDKEPYVSEAVTELTAFFKDKLD